MDINITKAERGYVQEWHDYYLRLAQIHERIAEENTEKARRVLLSAAQEAS
jgi:hypothetical protein